MISPSVLADAVLRTNSDAIVASDKDGIIRFWNPGAERIFGYTSGDAIGQSLDIIIPERLRARHWLGYRQVIDDRGEPVRPRRCPCRSGAPKGWNWHLARIHDRADPR